MALVGVTRTVSILVVFFRVYVSGHGVFLELP